MQRIAILTDGHSNPSDAKTATGILRYRGDEVVALIDRQCAGLTAEQVLGVGGAVPFVASIDDVEATSLLIGIAPAGGSLPSSWRETIRRAIIRGMDVTSGLHRFLGDDPEFAALAKEHGVRIDDVRRPPLRLQVSRNIARSTPAFRVHTVGHDCGVGKLVVALELTRALRKRGLEAEFVATGQTGIMIAGRGVAIDAVVSDFVSGAIEAEVVAAGDGDVVVIEGQGSLVHPLYSGVTLGLLHGCAPQAMVMVVDPTRTEVRHCHGVSIPPVEHLIEAYERMASFLLPSRVVAVALNTARLSSSAANRVVARYEERLGLPAVDVIRNGPDAIAEAVLAARASTQRARSGASES